MRGCALKNVMNRTSRQYFHVPRPVRLVPFPPRISDYVNLKTVRNAGFQRARVQPNPVISE